MKLTLIVTTPGSRQGQEIPVSKMTFVIGRDPQCQLRPASDKISRRHCEIRISNGNACVEDLQSTNGTFINDLPVEGVADLRHGDRLRVGPLEFEVRLLAAAPGPASDDEIVALLLSLDGSSSTPGANAIPTGETVPAAPAVPLASPSPVKDGVDTASAAGALLTTYRRRPQ